jgi:hypothetical protein
MSKFRPLGIPVMGRRHRVAIVCIGDIVHPISSPITR